MFTVTFGSHTVAPLKYPVRSHSPTEPHYAWPVIFDNGVGSNKREQQPPRGAMDLVHPMTTLSFIWAARRTDRRARWLRLLPEIGKISSLIEPRTQEGESGWGGE